jgi:putative tryptophan/tyrosine transport system substrate-binding protein
MASHIERRQFVATLGGAAAWPLAARAQQPAMPTVGVLYSGSPDVYAKRVAALRKGLSEAGFVEGRNVAFEFRWAAGQDSRLPELAADLVRRRVAVIAIPVNTPATLAAKAATETIPIVFVSGADPIALGLVASLNRPGGNVTGVSLQTVELVAKRLGLLRELAPAATRFVALVNPSSSFNDTIVKDLHAGAATLGLSIEILTAASEREIDAAFANLVQKPGSALLTSPDAYFFDRRAQLVTLAARHAVPAVYPSREWADIGGLISYGPDFEGGSPEATRRAFNKRFLLDLAEDWQQHGREVFKRVRRESPAAYLKVCAMLVPREMKLEHSGGVKAMTDEQLEQTLAVLKELIAQRDVGASAKVVNARARQARDIEPKAIEYQDDSDRQADDNPLVSGRNATP